MATNQAKDQASLDRLEHLALFSDAQLKDVVVQPTNLVATTKASSGKHHYHGFDVIYVINNIDIPSSLPSPSNLELVSGGSPPLIPNKGHSKHNFPFYVPKIKPPIVPLKGSKPSLQNRCKINPRMPSSLHKAFPHI
jgi:hypothetical protein